MEATQKSTGSGNMGNEQRVIGNLSETGTKGKKLHTKGAKRLKWKTKRIKKEGINADPRLSAECFFIEERGFLDNEEITVKSKKMAFK